MAAMQRPSPDLKRPGGRVTALGTVAAVAGISVLAATLQGCEKPKHPGFCPRPQAAYGVAPQFNTQEQDIRVLRRQAFHGDFFAQLDLARRYVGRDIREKNLEDPVEAAVWYEIALSNPDGYAPIVAAVEQRRGLFSKGGQSDDCRMGERSGAFQALERLLSRMSSDDRHEVHDRVIYVLSTQGAPGFRTLARLHDSAFGPFGDPVEMTPFDPKRPRDQRDGEPPASSSLFARNDVDVYLYDYLAAQAGDVAGFVMLKDFERSGSDRQALAADAIVKARRWTPPYEFYPLKAPDAGVPHSDESDVQGEVGAVALSKIGQLPFVHIGAALAYLHVIPNAVAFEKDLTVQDVSSFQAMLGRPANGISLSPLERVRAIQLAAVNGSPRSQLALAVMYAEGVGVPRDYARAFYWFSEADKQGNAEAKYAMSTYFSLGVQGVADQDKAAAVVYQIDSALSGFKPSAQRLREVLAQVSRPAGHSSGDGRGYPDPRQSSGPAHGPVDVRSSVEGGNR